MNTLTVVERVEALCQDVCHRPQHVFIAEPDLDLIEQLRKVEESPKQDPFPTSMTSSDDKLLFWVFYELLAGSVNYCYWVGKSEVRPGGSRASKMYALLDQIFVEARQDNTSKSRIISSFNQVLLKEGFPLVEKRCRHTQEITPELCQHVYECLQRGAWDNCLQAVITACPGYADDPFLKRLFLVFMQLHRRTSQFTDMMRSHVLVPADYHVPKVLRALKILSYSDELGHLVANSMPIPSGSSMECEIRASTILACQQLALQAGVSVEQVDRYLWYNKSRYSANFHLTVTSHY